MKKILIVLCCLVLIYSCSKEEVENSEEYVVVNIESNGGLNYAPIRIKIGSTIPINRLSPDPVIKDGGTFDGWYEDAELTQKYNFSSIVKENMTLYAKWLYKTHMVSLVMNGGPAQPPIEVREGSTFSVDRPSMEGKVFVGWYKDAQFSQLFNFNTKVVGDVSIYARWVDPSPDYWFGIDGDGLLVHCDPPSGTEIVVIPEGVKSIPDWFILAFGLNAPDMPGFPTGKNIKEFIFPQSLESLGAFSFKYAGVRSIIIPPKVKEIKAGTFEGCDDLLYMGFAPNSTLERISSNADNNMAIGSVVLEHLSLPPSLKYLSKYVFAGCSSLKTLTLERTESAVTIEEYMPGGGVWMFLGYFPEAVRMPDELKVPFLNDIRNKMEDYEYNKWRDMVQGY